MSSIPIWPILEHFGWTLPRDRGSWQTIRCGAHQEAHPSARATSENGGYVFCMACGFKGDAIDVVRHYRPEFTFVEAKRFAEDIAGHGGDDLSGPSRRGSSRSGVSGRSGLRSRASGYVPPRSRPA